MMRKFLPALLVIAALCLAPSCSDDEDDVISNPTENTGDQNTGDENTGDENTGDENTGDEDTGENTGDEDSPLVDGKIVFDGEAFTGYEAHTEETMRPVNPVFSVTEADMTEVSIDDVPDAILTTHSSGHTLAWLRSLAADYERGDYPTSLQAYKDGNRIEFYAEAYRWGLGAYSANHIEPSGATSEMTIKATSDKSVFYIDGNFGESYYSQAEMPNWGAGSYGGDFDTYGYEDVKGFWQIRGWSGMFSADGTQWDFIVSFYNIASGTDFTFRSGELSPAEAMAGHYYGTLDFDNKWLSATGITKQGTNSDTVGDPTGGTGVGDMYALIKPDANGDIRLCITGFDIDGNVFGNLDITGIKGYDKTNWAYEFDSNFTTQIPINGVMGTVTGSLEGEMTAQGSLLVYIYADFPVIGDVTLTYKADYTDWLSWNTYYGSQSNRPWSETPAE